MSDVTEIAKFSSEFEAQLAVAHLAAEGIEATVITDDGGGAIPTLSMLTGGVRILVRAENAEEAVRALSDAKVRDALDGPETDGTD